MKRSENHPWNVARNQERSRRRTLAQICASQHAREKWESLPVLTDALGVPEPVNPSDGREYEWNEDWESVVVIPCADALSRWSR